MVFPKGSFVVPLNKLIGLFNGNFRRSSHLPKKMKNAFCTSALQTYNNHMGEALIYILTLLHSERPNLHTVLAFLGAIWLDNIYLRLGSKSHRPIAGILIDTTCGLLMADLFLFCYERDFMASLSERAEIFQALNST